MSTVKNNSTILSRGSRVGVFLQVRLDSSRLPGKALLTLGGKSVVRLAMEALRAVPAEVYALLTDAESSQGLTEYAAAAGFEVYTGPKDDVLKRYARAIEYYQVETVIRATGDNPLVSGECAARLLELYRSRSVDYSGFYGLPVGTGVECVRAEALLRADRSAAGAYEREHVCPYLYNNPQQFVIYRPSAPPECFAPELRVTLDTERDYRRLLTIFDSLYTGEPISTERLIRGVAQLHLIAG
ncbi:MAG: cytidylyltransferase domain-containing protein [Spirochaetota bacterium]